MTKTEKAKNTARTSPASTEDAMTTAVSSVTRGNGGLASPARRISYKLGAGPS